ncbi:tRNA-specific adenosine deaminase [Candidatus Woesearchaeota archaeon CG10_big_fil_rev_8_21_14_0_10_45_16]|nr:MAG: tRNA-specific adenosine deaminase [Candidatus Woesearchaeota archaeon CG10_big_fil_rev_8_21_14_0_10_45_16]
MINIKKNSALTNTVNDEKFMKLAIEEAKNAPFPFGCVLVKDNQIIATGKSGETNNFDPTAHAEINAIRSACEKLNSKELLGVTLYSTCEPCPMCLSASWWANISRIVFGISLEESSKLFGPEILVSADYLNGKGANKIEIKGGVLKEEVIKLYDRSEN